MQALSAALLEHPEVNSSLSEGGQQLRVHHAHNVGIAMATNSGLVVPNIKHVQAQSVASIAAELKRLQQLAFTGRLPAEDLAGECCIQPGNRQCAYSEQPPHQAGCPAGNLAGVS